MAFLCGCNGKPFQSSDSYFTKSVVVVCVAKRNLSQKLKVLIVEMKAELAELKRQKAEGTLPPQGPEKGKKKAKKSKKKNK